MTNVFSRTKVLMVVFNRIVLDSCVYNMTEVKTAVWSTGQKLRQLFVQLGRSLHSFVFNRTEALTAVSSIEQKLQQPCIKRTDDYTAVC